MSTQLQTVKANTRHFPRFASEGAGITLRPYQIEAANQIIQSIKKEWGLTIVIIISRQAGKDELLANLKNFLLFRFADDEVGIVECNPTYKPQTINAIERLEARLDRNHFSRMIWRKRSDFMRYIGKAKVSFLSGDATANVVGAVASLLLIVNEAQDIEPAIYDKKFAPMTASTNATQVIVGTEWTERTLLAREHDAALAAQKKDGRRRVFKYTADDVRKVVKNYGRFVDKEIKKLGRQHPLIKSQYFCERIDAVADMFNARRLALMKGDRPGYDKPIAGTMYALKIDVAGVDEQILELEGMSNPGRDFTTLSIDEVDISNIKTTPRPIYRTIFRLDWHGQNHVTIFGAISAIIDSWNPMAIVIDSTGVGEGLTSMLVNRYPLRQIVPVKFTAQRKSEIGYSFLGIIEAGRFRDCTRTDEILEQYQNCENEILTGPQKTMRWGVKDGTRGKDGQLVHDDYIIADSFVAELDKLEWFAPSETILIPPKHDVLEEMDHAY